MAKRHNNHGDDPINGAGIVQPYTGECAHRDIRAVVVGGNLMYAVIRTNNSDFRANIGQGGTGKLIKHPTPQLRETATRAAAACGPEFAGST